MKNKLLIAFIPLLILLVILVILIIKNNSVLNKTNWKLVAWSISSIDPQISDVTLNFKNNKINGNGGVNIYNGHYRLGFDNKIFLSNIESTEMASTNSKINEAESNYFNLLIKVKYYILNNDTLKLYDKNKNELLIFEKK